MSPLDLIRSSGDGSLSLTKLAATTAHALMAVAFFKQQVWGDPTFNETAWMVYGLFAIGHAAYDKTSAQVKDFKDRKLESETPAPSVETQTTTTTKTKE